jgi:hypothetical protein
VDYPIIGYVVTGFAAHLDAGYAWGIDAQLIQYDPVHFDQIVTGAHFNPGETDVAASIATPIPMPFDPTHIELWWPITQPHTATATHYTGYADVTYGDVDEIPPPPLAGAPQLVTILG